MALRSGSKRFAARWLRDTSALTGYLLIFRQLQKLTVIASGEKNRLHTLLIDYGIRLSVVVSDVYGKSVKPMIMGLQSGETPEQLLPHADPRRRSRPAQGSFTVIKF
jgi:hypothetical protein